MACCSRKTKAWTRMAWVTLTKLKGRLARQKRRVPAKEDGLKMIFEKTDDEVNVMSAS